eukprot:CAMPEP_0172497402 /NCGR_PEP_ID=MMETSP1066-20121228/99364_1 /TAXON_ID=671091 /ORGANISM="Coscinodiscus wailesii, Strain CCMP2513" /LENGTH=164 /DNA_ID=CAMNT_0013270151 /DNA_START=109 /DNA_END=603 /DNA_ORIENTATION=-
MRFSSNSLLAASLFICGSKNSPMAQDYNSMEETMRPAFDAMDTDGNGVLSLEELSSGMIEKWEQVFWKQIDKDNNGIVDEAEFITLTGNAISLQPDKSSFSDMDTDSDGKITKEEVTVYAKNMVRDQIFQQSDLDGDGSITFDEMFGHVLATMGKKGGRGGDEL